MSLLNDFDFGADVTKSTGAKKVNPEVGLHFARLKSIIHLGTVEREFKGTKKDPSNRVVAIFELKGGDEGVDDLHPETGEPLTIGVGINLIQGDNSFLNSKFLPALVTKKEADAGTIKGFDDLIGRACQLNLIGSKATGEDGKPQYVDIKGISALMSIVAASVPQLSDKGVGHCRLNQLSVDALDELNTFVDIQEGIMKSTQWANGTHPAIPLIDEIRKERPNFAKGKPKVGKADSNDSEPSVGTPSTPSEELAGDEEF